MSGHSPGALRLLRVSRNFGKLRASYSATTRQQMLDLGPINEALKRRGVKGRIVPARSTLFLRGTFTTTDGSRKDRRIPLGLPANDGQLLEAESRVIALAGIIATTGIVPDELPWETPTPTFKTADKTAETTVATAVERLEEDFWQGKVRTSAAARTWD